MISKTYPSQDLRDMGLTLLAVGVEPNTLLMVSLVTEDSDSDSSTNPGSPAHSPTLKGAGPAQSVSTL